MSLTLDDVQRLACLRCGEGLVFDGDLADDCLDAGTLRCCECRRSWPVRRGVARLVDEAAVAGMDRLLRPVYDLIAPVHDLGVDLVLPLIQFPDAGNPRDRYLQRLELRTLAPRPDGQPLRILEVGVGPGANLRLLENALDHELAVELWGVDLSTGMLAECRRRLRARPLVRRTRLLAADAHALPFPDGAFDRVFHVGAINGYRDRRRALAEMARVARRGTPIVVVDEELDPSRAHSPLHWALFRALTLYDADPHAPRAHLPPEAEDVEVSAASRFYYCLRFRMPAADDGAAAGAAAPTGEDTMPTIADELPPAVLAAFRDAYDAAVMRSLLEGFFPTAYPPSADYVHAVGAQFYDHLPADTRTDRERLSPADRERCLVAILASRGPGLNLAIHVYMALMTHVSAAEVAHILFLAGIYTGVDAFAESLKVEQQVLRTLARLHQEGTHAPAGVVGALQRVYAV